MKGLRKIFAGIALLTVVALCCAVLPMQADAATEWYYTEGYYTYEVSNGEVTITDVNTSISGSITIPDTLGGHPVISIGDYAFDSCTALTAITIPDSVTSIDYNAFRLCSSLTSITIPDSVTSIGDDAFWHCTGLTEITIPDSVTSIGDDAFYDCNSLTYNTYDNGMYLGNATNPYVYLAKATSSSITSINIHPNTKFIGDDAFYGCTGLTSVTIGSGVTSIGDDAFYNCTGLTEITIPDSVTSIGSYAFYRCTGLTEITIPDSVTSIGGSAFSGCTGLTYNIFDNAKYLGNEPNPYFALVEVTSDEITQCEIAGSTKLIGDDAFFDCTGLADNSKLQCCQLYEYG